MSLDTLLLCTFLQSSLPISATTLSESLSKDSPERAYTQYISWRGDRELEDTSDMADLLQWWQQQRITSLKQEADVVRNGVLQEVFAIRRRLALCSAQQTAQKRDNLDCAPQAVELDLEKIHTSLNQLSDRLDPPYIQESLPLAIGYAVDKWKASLPLILHLPQVWSSEPTVHAYLLLVFLNEFCKTLIAQSTPQTTRAALLSCNISLKCASDSKNLTITLSYIDPVPAATITQLTARLTPIVQTFQLLSKGDFTMRLAANNATFKLIWCDN